MANNQTIDARIAKALADKSTDRNLLAALCSGAERAIEIAMETVDIESKAALDIANADPDAADQKARVAQRTIDRLTKALPQLKARVDAIDACAATAAWRAEADQLKAQRDALADELAATYPAFVAKIADLFNRIDRNTAAINDLHGRAPYGETRRLADAEQSARGLQYSAETPPLRELLRLPDWVRSRDIAFPAHFDFFAAASLAAQQTQAALAAKFALAASPDWAAAKDLANEQEREEHARRDAQLAEQQAEAKRAFEQSLIENDRRRRLGISATENYDDQSNIQRA